MKAIHVFLPILFFVLAGAAQAAEPSAVGHVKSVSGTASVRHGAATKTVRLGTPVYQGDELLTGADGAMGVTFVDNSMLSLGPDSRLAINTMVFDPVDNQLGFVSSLNQGTLVMISGLIGKMKPESIQVNTPTSVIGIRGTRFAIRVSGQ